VAALRLPTAWWCELDAVTRLLYVRTALFILSEPKDPPGRQQTPLATTGFQIGTRMRG
jgi:hypothetical protein